jgi:hypothetical protein
VFWILLATILHQTGGVVPGIPRLNLHPSHRDLFNGLACYWMNTLATVIVLLIRGRNGADRLMWII